MVSSDIIKKKDQKVIKKAVCKMKVEILLIEMSKK
jgi:hypothetical protein